MTRLAEQRKGWRRPLVVAFFLFSFACSHGRIGETGPDNEVVRFLKGAERQAETDLQRREIRRGLEDLMTLPPDDLRTRRYADYEMHPGQWSLATLLMRYLVPRDLHIIDEERLYRDAQAPAAKDVIRQHIKAIDEGRQVVSAP